MISQDDFKSGIQWATEGFTQWNPYGEPGGAKVAAVLGQSDDEEGQTRRMAMTVVATALIFHEALAESNFVVEEYGEDRHLMHVDDLKVSGMFTVPSLVKDEWGAILRVNYWPIFWTANQVLNKMSVSQNVKVLNVLWRAVQDACRWGSDPLPRSDRDRFPKVDRRPQVPGHVLYETGRRVPARRSCDAGGPPARRERTGATAKHWPPFRSATSHAAPARCFPPPTNACRCSTNFTAGTPGPCTPPL